MSKWSFLVPSPGALVGLGGLWGAGLLMVTAGPVPRDGWPLIALLYAAALSLVALGTVGLMRQAKVDERDGLRRRGLCVECGYDLTANASGVCPECGTPKG
jgi:hypothetical protein